MVSADPAVAAALREVPGLRSGVRDWLKKKPPAVRADRGVVLAAVQRDGLALEHAAVALRGDREVVLAAVRKGAFALQFATPDLLADRNFILAAVQHNGYALACAPSKFRADHEVVLTAVREEAAALEYASERLKANSEVALVAARWSQPALEHVAESLWTNRAFVLAVTERNAAAVEYFAAELRTDEALLLSLIERNAEVLSFVPQRLLAEEGFLLAALSRNAAALDHTPESFQSDQAFLLSAAKRNSSVWERLPEELWWDEGFVLAALKQDACSFQRASPQLRASWDFVLKAVEHSASALERASSRLRGNRDFVLAAVGQNAASLAFAAAELRLDQSFALAAVQQNDLAAGHLPACLWGDPNFVLAMVDLDPSFLALATEELRADSAFALRAVHQQGLALEHTVASVRADREVVEAALASDVRALKHAAHELRADRSLVLPLVERSGGALQYAAETLQADREVVLAAVRADGDALAHAVLELREDRQFVLQAVQEDGSAFAHAATPLRSDRSFVLQAVGKQGHALQFAAERLLKDEDFLLAAVKRNAWALSYVPAEQRASHAFVLAAVRTNSAALRFAPHRLQEDPAFVRAAKNGYVNGGAADAVGEGSDSESSLEDLFDFCELTELQLTGAESELAQEWEPEQTVNRGGAGDEGSHEPDDSGGGFFDFGELDELQQCADAFAGEWEDEEGTVIAIKGMAMHGPDGTLDLKMVSADTCTCQMGLDECEAQLGADGNKLLWSDGCVWTRRSRESHEFPQLETLSTQQLQAEYQRLGLPLEPGLVPATCLARLKLAALCAEAPLMEVVRLCRSRQVPTAGISHLPTEAEQRQALRRRLLTRDCADAWQALEIPASRFASMREAAKAAQRCARLENMSVAALEAEHRALGLPLDRVMQRRELELPLKAVRVWQGLSLRELQRECRIRGLVPKEPSPGEHEEQQRDRLLVRLVGTLSASALGGKGIPLQRLASVEVGVRVSEQWDRLEKLSAKGLEEECAALDLPPGACLQWYGRGDVVARLKLMALWREFSLEELSGECKKRGVAVDKLPAGPELHSSLCRALLLDLFADLYEERGVPVRQLGLLKAATAVFLRWQQLADMNDAGLLEEFRKLLGARPHDAIAPAEVRSRLQQAAIWDWLPPAALRECCRQQGIAAAGVDSFAEQQLQHRELLEPLLQTLCVDVYSCRGIHLRELGSLAAAAALLERWQRLDGLSEPELAEEYSRHGLPSPARDMRGRLRSMARWNAMPYAALQQEVWAMGLRSLYFQSFKELKGDKQQLLQQLAAAAWVSGREQPRAPGPPPPGEPEEEEHAFEAKPEGYSGASQRAKPGRRVPRQSAAQDSVVQARPRPEHVVEHLRTLGLPGEAGLEEVKKAYRKLALRLHPDKNPDGTRESATQLFQEVGEAYEALLGYLKDSG